MKMTSGTGDAPSEKSMEAIEGAELVRLGIMVVSVNHYHYKTFRYTNAKDAIAEAQRDVNRVRGRSETKG